MAAVIEFEFQIPLRLEIMSRILHAFRASHGRSDPHSSSSWFSEPMKSSQQSEFTIFVDNAICIAMSFCSHLVSHSILLQNTVSAQEVEP